MAGSDKNTAGEQLSGGLNFVTSTLGNTVGGVSKTAGNVTGAATQGVGDTVNNATGTKPVGNVLSALGGGLQGGLNDVGQGAENAGNWKKQ